jgi:hypothetical protein
MDKRLDTWTAEGVKRGLIGFYREIAGVGLVFPRADRPIAVEFPRLSCRQASTCLDTLDSMLKAGPRQRELVRPGAEK